MPITDISQNPFNKSQIIIGTGNEIHGIPGYGAFISNDGGSTWLNARVFEVDYHDIRFHESDPNVA